MKPYLYKFILFFSPILVLYFITKLYYRPETGGDLNRVGYLSADPSYRDKFQEDLNKPISYDNLIYIDLLNPKTYTVLTVGDSFSHQGNHGYQNFLETEHNIEVLDYNIGNTINPIKELHSIINGDLLENINIEYIVLESVERLFTKRVQNLNRNDTIFTKDLIFNKSNRNSIKKYDINFPPIEAIKYPLYNFLYNFDDNAFISNLYTTKLSSSMFTGVNPRRLLFINEDLKHIKLNNNVDAITQLNWELNSLSEKLRQKGITLIVLSCPDKYDIYYDYISNKKPYYIKPLFFEIIKSLPKDYLFIPSKETLREAIKIHRDVYFYDDTHWSPIGSKIIASKINEVISNNSLQGKTR